MDNNSSQNNHFTESINLQQSTAAVIQPGHENSSNMNHNVVNADLSMINDNNIFPFYTNTNRDPFTLPTIILPTIILPTLTLPTVLFKQ
ncbi:hypothetical protein RhiirB3_446779 [Rhizophagus irregularis]|nr:hypothetical protein RhiirB3_446779 [Rhizophagus irregularis]